MEDEEDEEWGDWDEGEWKEDGGDEGVWELETEEELTLSEPELCWQRWVELGKVPCPPRFFPSFC